jgi:exonuclease SbcD
MKNVLAIIFNDVHLKTGNEDEVYESTKYMVNYAVENDIKNLIFAGDLFDSRTFQRQKVLQTLDKMLDLFHANGLTLYMFSGNHDKTVYNSPNSFLDIYRHHPCVKFNRELKNIVLDGVSIDLLPFFSTELLVPMIEKAKGGDILISHFGMDGSNHLGHIQKDTNINKKMFEKWDKVYLGHYHNHNEITKDIVHLPSFRQENFGEDNNKGFALLKKDGSYELIKGKFKEYIKLSIDLDKTSSKDISKLIELHKNSESTIRLEFNGTEVQCKSIDKSQFKETGIDVKMKYAEIYENEIAEPSKIIERYSKDQILDSFKDFCKDKGYNYSEGSGMVKEFLNK